MASISLVYDRNSRLVASANSGNALVVGPAFEPAYMAGQLQSQSSRFEIFDGTGMFPDFEDAGSESLPLSCAPRRADGACLALQRGIQQEYVGMPRRRECSPASELITTKLPDVIEG